jgi:ankyrin repeat protein
MSSQTRKLTALAIVISQGYTDYFPATALEKRIPTMPFGEVVRTLQRLNAANFRSLAICHRGLTGSGERHERTYMQLRVRLYATYDGAAGYVRWGMLGAALSLTHAKRILNALEDRSDEGQTALWRAARDGDQLTVRALTTHGGDIDAQDEERLTPLMAAMDFYEIPTAQLLISLGCGTNIKNSYGETALMKAAERGWIDIAEALLTAKADVNATDRAGCTALMRAVRSSRAETRVAMINLLATTGARLDAQDNRKETALAAACKLGFIDSVKRLIELRADIGLPDCDGMTPHKWSQNWFI